MLRRYQVSLQGPEELPTMCQSENVKCNRKPQFRVYTMFSRVAALGEANWPNSKTACQGGFITWQTTHWVVEVKVLSRNQKLCRPVDASQARFGRKIFQAFSNRNEATDEECQHIFFTRGHSEPSCGSCSSLSVLTKRWPAKHLLSALEEPQRREGGCLCSQAWRVGDDIYRVICKRKRTWPSNIVRTSSGRSIVLLDVSAE